MGVRFLPQHLRRGLQALWFIFLCVLFLVLLLAAPHDQADARGSKVPATATVTATATSTPGDVTCITLPRSGRVVCVQQSAQTQDAWGDWASAADDVTAAAPATSTATATSTCIELPRRGRTVCVQSP